MVQYCIRFREQYQGESYETLTGATPWTDILDAIRASAVLHMLNSNLEAFVEILKEAE